MRVWSTSEHRLIVAVTAAFILGNSVHAAAPLLVNAFVTGYGWAESRAGLLASIEFAGIALTSVLVAPYVSAFRKWKLGLAGCILAMGMQLISMLTVSLAALMAARFLSGFGAGVVLAVGTAVASTASRPARTFAVMNAASALALGGLVAAGGVIINRFGVIGGFGLIALVFLLLLPPVVMIPERSVDSDRGKSTGRLPHFLAGCLVVAGFIVFNGSSGLCYAFVMRLGEAAGLDLAQASSIMAASFIVGFAGSALAGWMDSRHGLTRPLIGGILTVGLSWFVISFLLTPPVFIVAIVINTAAYFFAIPYIMSTAATLDKEGRWAAIGSTAMLLSMVIAPALGGWILQRAGPVALGASALAGTTAGLVLLLLALARYRRVSAGQPSPTERLRSLSDGARFVPDDVS